MAAMTHKDEAINLRSTALELSLGIMEVTERLEAKNGGEPTDESLDLRGYFSQLNALSEEVNDNGTVNWQKLDDRLGVDLVGLDGSASSASAVAVSITDDMVETLARRLYEDGTTMPLGPWPPQPGRVTSTDYAEAYRERARDYLQQTVGSPAIS